MPHSIVKALMLVPLKPNAYPTRGGASRPAAEVACRRVHGTPNPRGSVEQPMRVRPGLDRQCLPLRLLCFTLNAAILQTI